MSHSASARVRVPQPDPVREILIVDDEKFIRHLLRAELEKLGYHVRDAEDGRSALDEIHRQPPDLVLLDLMMPNMEGTEVCRELRQSARTSSIPVIMLTKVDSPDEMIRALNCGANDYLTKPHRPGELDARVRNALDLRDQLRDESPLTRLPGNTQIERELRRRVATQVPFTYLYLDIDDFKPFNDLYGHGRGDQLILATAELLRRCLEEHGAETDFIGHVGGDDFVVMCSPERAPEIAEAIARGFDDMVVEHLDARERQRECIEVQGRTGRLERHRLTSLTVAMVGGLGQVFEHAAQVSARAAEVKRNAKGQARRGERGRGSLVVLERRASPKA